VVIGALNGVRHRRGAEERPVPPVRRRQIEEGHPDRITDVMTRGAVASTWWIVVTLSTSRAR